MTHVIFVVILGIANALLFYLDCYKKNLFQRKPEDLVIMFFSYVITISSYLLMFIFPTRGISLVSNVVIIGLIFILVPQLVAESIARINKKQIEILAILLILCFMTFIADQQAFFGKKMPEEVPITYINFPETNDILIMDASQPEFVATDISVLEKVDWESLSHSNGKRIIRSLGCDAIVIIKPERIVAYLNIKPTFVVRNPMPHEFMLKNPRNLGLVADNNDIPYYKYALLRHDSFGSYVIGKYALCNALTFEVSYFDKLPNWAK